MKFNYKLADYVNRHLTFTGVYDGQGVYTKDPQVMYLYHIYNSTIRKAPLVYCKPANLTISMYIYKRFTEWVRWHATASDCLDAGFSEHDIMELFR